ncbi:MAG TPA: thioredoxin domain-containing protein, partial [Anaerolineales bacterium]|nr:thioredoxin domain-containing protein [Anaerolineales bacterium]
MPAFRDVLAGIARTWKEDRVEVDRVSGQLSDHLQQSLNTNIKTDKTFTQEQLDEAAKALVDNYDWENGGWGAAPKFPQPMSIEFLLRRASPSALRADRSAVKDEARSIELKVSIHALKAMARGGMYDVVGGGFSRYSVDQFWRVPHFEKMLYDNAQLARAYLHAWQLTGDEFFKRVVVETLDFIAREMTHPDGGFYSSLDADSEGEEGKFYVWSIEEIREILNEDFEFFEAAYGINARGNWEGKTVLQRAQDDSTLAARFKLDPGTVSTKLAELHSMLLSARASRVRPGTDDKILTAWNGLMLETLAEAARAIANSDGNPEIAASRLMKGVSPHNDIYYHLATRNAEFLLNFLRPDGKLRRSWRDGRPTNEVFLEDYAALILGLIELYQTDFDNKWFAAAQDLTDEMIELFNDPSGGFFDTSKDSEALLLRPKDLQDNATPSGNALACEALLKLSAFTDNGKYRDLAERSLGLVAGMAVQHPTAFARWLSAADFSLGNAKQVAVVYEASGSHEREL